MSRGVAISLSRSMLPSCAVGISLSGSLGARTGDETGEDGKAPGIGSENSSAGGLDVSIHLDRVTLR